MRVRVTRDILLPPDAVSTPKTILQAAGKQLCLTEGLWGPAWERKDL